MPDSGSCLESGPCVYAYLVKGADRRWCDCIQKEVEEARQCKDDLQQIKALRHDLLEGARKFDVFRLYHGQHLRERRFTSSVLSHLQHKPRGWGTYIPGPQDQESQNTWPWCIVENSDVECYFTVNFGHRKLSQPLQLVNV